MGYLFIALALFAGCTKGYCGKKTSGFVEKSKDAVFISFIRMLLCILIGAILIIAAKDTPYLIPDAKMLPVYLLSGVSTSAFVVIWMLAVRKSAYMLIDIFLMLGVLIPLILANILFDEPVKPTQWLGIAILIVAVLIMCSYNSGLKGKMSFTSVLLLILTGASNGIADFSQKLFVRTADGVPTSVFNFYTYVFSAVTLLICYIVFRQADNKDSKSSTKIPKVMYVYVAIMAACLFANSYFKTVAAYTLDSAKLYPLNQGAALILSSLMSAFLFGEKLTFKAIIGIVLSFIALIIIKVL